MEHRTLIETDELARHLQDPAWRIIDVRHNLADVNAGFAHYSLAHIPGAHFLHLDRDLSAQKTGNNGRHPLPSAASFSQTLRRIGVDQGQTIVIYDDAGGMIAARLWWMLRWCGIFSAGVLNGGWQKWCAEQRPTSAERPSVTPSEFSAGGNRHAWVDVDYVQQHLARDDMLLLDARSAERFRGENETLDPVGGHIPGARNHFFQHNLDARACFKSAGELRSQFHTLLGDCPPQQVIHQCGSGVTACHNLLAMEVAGLHGSRLYPGSWSEWCADPARPIVAK